MHHRPDEFIRCTRSWQCIEQIDNLKKSILNHPFIVSFIHDITYGKGKISILPSNPEYLTLYYNSPLPAFFTNESGRMLPDGIYICDVLPMSDEEIKRLGMLKQIFNFNHMLNIVKHERNIQHTYSFTLNCNEQQFFYFVANKLPYIQRFISIYERKCRDAINFVKAEKNHLILPYSTGKIDALSTFLELCIADEESCDYSYDCLRIQHAVDNQLVKLPPQQVRCLQLLLRGRTAKEIAREMQLSYRTIQHYTSIIYEKLGLENSRELLSHYSYLKDY